MQKRLFGILASIAVIAAACGGATTTSAPPAGSQAPGASPTEAASPAPSTADLATEQILKIDLGTEPATLDPNKAQSSDAIAVLSGIQRGLVYFDKDLKVVPELAAALPEISADAKTLTFTLKDGIKYSNGDPIVAGDLVYGWKRLLDPRTAAPYAYVMAEVVGAEDLLALAGADPGPSDADITKLFATAPRPANVASMKAFLSMAWVSAIRKSLFIVGQALRSAHLANGLRVFGSVPLL